MHSAGIFQNVTDMFSIPFDFYCLMSLFVERLDGLYKARKRTTLVVTKYSLKFCLQSRYYYYVNLMPYSGKH